MPKSRTTRRAPRRPRSKPKARRRFLLPIVGLIVLGSLGCLATFYLIDQRTQRILKARGTAQSAGVYADARRITQGQKLPPELLRSELARRGYREVGIGAKAPGEFYQDADGFVIRTRSFISADGTLTPSVLAFYTPLSGQIAIQEGLSSASFSLEPQLLADLGSAEIRASRFTSLAKIPARMRDAVIAIEDERFFNHHGIDLVGIARATLINIRAMGVVQGGSTLTQQLAKNIFLSPRRTFGRKILEVFTALSLERLLTKEQILELYLNEVYLGQEGAVALHGVAEAARNFFDKDLSQITLAESALLAGIIKAPSALSPRRHLARSIRRRNVVLARMLELGIISEKEYQTALLERPQLRERTESARQAPHFTSAIRKMLISEHGIDSAAIPNLRIFTGIDSELQRCAERAASQGVAELEKRNRALQRRPRRLEAGLVAIEPFSGKVRAWAGGRDFRLNQFDHVSQAKRPVGSTIKPFVYLTALDAQLNRYKVATTTSILADEPTTIQIAGAPDWSPSNYDKEFRGDVSLRYALEHSLNLPAVYLAQRIGLDSVAATIERFNLSRKIPAVPSLVLGAAETSLLELTASYGALANGGVYVQPRPFISVIDQEGDTVTASQVSEQRVAAEGPVFVLTNMLQGVVERGTATRVRALGYNAEAAGKTGTTDEARDAWFIGFTPDLVAGVWVGFDDNRKVGLTGGMAAVPIWTEFMKCAAQFREPQPFIPPQSVSFVRIDSASGLRASPACPTENLVEEIFVRGTEPEELCDLHPYEDSMDSIPAEGDNPQGTTLPQRRPSSEKGLWESLVEQIW